MLHSANRQSAERKMERYARFTKTAHKIAICHEDGLTGSASQRKENSMKFSNWTPKDLEEWAALLPSSQLMDCHNKIKICGEIHVDNSEPKQKEEQHETD